MRPVKFRSALEKAPADSGWHYIPVKAAVGEKFEKKDGTRRIVCTINGTERFQCALIPWGEIFTIIVNKEKRDRLGVIAGDPIEVLIEPDTSKYGLPMPEELREVLDQDPEGDRLFHSLTAGKQRSILYFVGKIKDIDKRIHTALIFVEHIKRNDGRIVHEKLSHELKRPLL